ncbi:MULTISPECIES: anti-sigma factor [Shouchella]|uniref:Regulator of SigK n=2 Tax=Shouchella TaxID=2893057 RepID=A0ABY7W167_9BACI|nr:MULTISPECIES: anti-sigma factor [Shouchella]MED4128424.1 anti-sigma factor [Shouchella miscanthi]WDF02599.1 anti-sigma factor [Shouchella hunanensis]GAF20799.1 hypothetical protein JCM19047_456 [Bacillus sp. JCM 19047]
MSDKCTHLIDYVNGQLTDTETKEFEAHFKTCSTCEEELNEIRALTDDLGFDVDPVEPPPEMKERILSAAFAEKAPVESQSSDGKKPIAVGSTTNKQEQHIQKRKKKANWLIPAMAAALFLSLIGNIYTVSQLGEPDDVAIEPSITVDSLVQRLNLQPAAETIPFQATASFVNKDHYQQLVVEAEQLSQPEDTQVYQVWLLKDGEPYRAGTFTPAEDGSGISTFDIDPEMGYDTIAITIEPDETSETPEGDIVLVEEL